jgi:phage repressor protein C with HTH and peptisase S24 domain
MNIGARIRLARGKQTREAFAQRLGIHPQTLYRYESGGRSVDADLLMKICTECSISSEWIIFGKGSMYAAASPLAVGNADDAPTTAFQAAAPPSRERVEAPSFSRGGAPTGIVEETGTAFAARLPYAAQYAEGEIMMVPMVEAHLSAGHGSFQVNGDVTRHYAFRSDFLMRKGQVAHMVLMRVDGDSMAPQILNNDVVLLEQSQKDLRPGKIYAVGVEDMVYLKKVDAKPGEITLYSINEDYPPLHIDTRGDQEDCIRIIGRAVWWCRED